MENVNTNFMQILPPTPPKEFVEWLKGFADAIGEGTPTIEQWKRIRDRLMVTKEQVVYPPIPYEPYKPFEPWNPWQQPVVTYTSSPVNTGPK